MVRLFRFLQLFERDRSVRRLLVLASAATFIGALLALLLGLMGAYLPRLDLIMQFTVQLGLLALAGLSALLICGRRIPILAAGGAIAFLLPALISYWSFSFAKPEALSQTSLKVLTYNIWAANKNFDQMIDLFDRHQADVLILHEFARWHAPLLQPLKDRYPYSHTCENNWHCHTVIFSKHPWASTGRQIRDRTYPELAWIQFGQDLGSVRIYGVHMARPLESTVRQGKELRALANLLRSTNNPYIIGGDFNATPWSITVRRLKKWAELNAFPGILPSWPIQQHRVAWFPPQLAIDHLFFSSGIEAKRVYLGRPAGSDHLPIVGEFEVSGTVRTASAPKRSSIVQP